MGVQEEDTGVEEEFVWTVLSKSVCVTVRIDLYPLHQVKLHFHIFIYL